MFTAQVPPRTKSLVFAPPGVNDAMVSVPPPLLVKLMLFAPLVFPTFTVPKLNADELNVAAAADEVERAACVTKNVAPPRLRFALRCAPVLAAADQATVALPVPLVVDETVSQLALLPRFHGQPGPAVSATLPVPPPATTLALVGLRTYVHPLAWLTVTA
jgi:hypothetical protein